LEFYFRFRCRPFRRNLRLLLHQATAFRPNRSTYCGNMTSCPFLKMAAAAAQYYFRFRICWSHCLWKVNILSTNQISSTNLYSRLRYNYFRFWKTNDRHIGILLPVSISTIDYFAVIGALFCIGLPNFIQIGSSTAEISNQISNIKSIFKMSAISHVVFALGVMADHQRSAFRRLNLILKSLVRRINSSIDITMYRFWRFGLKLPIHAHFGGVFGAYFPIWRHLSPWSPKGPSLGGNTSFEPHSIRIGATVRPGRMTEK